MINVHESASTSSGRSIATISGAFRTPERYYRSVHLERDFQDPRAVQQYVLTPRMREPFLRILDGVAAGSTRRAWRVTGDYGSGKSSFALVLAQLLNNARQPELLGVRQTLSLGKAPKLPSLLPVLITGHRARLVPTIAKAVLDALVGAGVSNSEAARSAERALQRAITDGNDSDLVKGVSLARDAVAAIQLQGIVLVMDELGKFLEHAAIHPAQDDVFALQSLAEVASRSGDRPIILVGILHQGFQAYAERLGHEARLEWEKVAGRFEEITFDQPVSHTAALVRAALNVRIERLPPSTDTVAAHLLSTTRAAGWLTGTPDFGPETLLGQYPLHPSLLPVLVRFFARYGQNERSLFNFLLSHEIGGLQEFAERPIAPDAWYTIAEFYDFVRASYGHALGGSSHQTHWSRLVDTLDSQADAPDDQLRLLKAVAILNVIDECK